MKKEINIKLLPTNSILRFYNYKDKKFNFLDELINIDVYFDDSYQPYCSGDIANIIIQRNSPQNNVFEIKIPDNPMKVNIILSTNSDFDLEAIKVKAV